MRGRACGQRAHTRRDREAGRVGGAPTGQAALGGRGGGAVSASSGGTPWRNKARPAAPEHSCAGCAPPGPRPRSRLKGGPSTQHPARQPPSLPGIASPRGAQPGTGGRTAPGPPASITAGLHEPRGHTAWPREGIAPSPPASITAGLHEPQGRIAGPPGGHSTGAHPHPGTTRTAAAPPAPLTPCS